MPASNSFHVCVDKQVLPIVQQTKNKLTLSKTLPLSVLHNIFFSISYELHMSSNKKLTKSKYCTASQRFATKGYIIIPVIVLLLLLISVLKLKCQQLCLLCNKIDNTMFVFFKSESYYNSCIISAAIAAVHLSSKSGDN